MGNGAIVGIVVVAAVVLVLGGVVFGVVSARRARRGPAVPDPDTRATTVAGRRATVRTPPFVERQWVGMQNGRWSRAGGIVEIRVHGPVATDAFTVLPRHRPEEDLGTPGLPPAVSAFVDSTLRAAAVRGTAETPTGDAAFDDRYRVTTAAGADPEPVRRALSPPVRAVLLDHDFLHLLVRSDGAWATVFYAEATTVPASEQAARHVLELVVTGER